MRGHLSEHSIWIIIPFHLLLISSFIGFFFVDEALSYLLWAPLFWFLFSGLGIAIGYHRLLSHQAFETHWLMKRILATLGMMAGQGSPVFWVAVHNGLHHKYSDTDKDPHTPQKGVWNAMMGWQFNFSRKDFDVRYAIDVLRDPYLRFMSLNYYQAYWIFIGVLFLIHWKFALFALIPATALSLWEENIVNAFGHMPRWGYRNFKTEDLSTNNWLLGFLFWGQGYHNNHHHNPNTYNYGVKWWELDLCAWIVPLLAKRKPQSWPLKNKASLQKIK